MTRAALAGLLLLLAPGLGLAQSPPEGQLNNPGAFERGFTVSLYQFDACGDPLAGRMFRRALAERFAQCPFSPEAQARFQRRTRAEQANARGIMERMIEANGGLPRQLDRMSMTCHQQQASDDYRSFRRQLERYAQGALAAEAILPARCDAADIMP